MNKTKKGMFIAFEGNDGSGKSTQIKLLNEFLIEKGYETIATFEPGGTSIGSQIRSVLLDIKNVEMDPITEAYLYAASRAQHVKEVIKPALKNGKIVISDRYIDSSIAYQGLARKLGKECIKEINKYAINNVLPDVTIVLLTEPKIGLQRACERAELDRMEIEELSFHQEIYNYYKSLDGKKGYIILDGDDTIENISLKIINSLNFYL